MFIFGEREIILRHVSTDKNQFSSKYIKIDFRLISDNIIIKSLDMDIDLQKFIKCDVFTPDKISKIMSSKLNNKGNILEPSVGSGNLLKYINLENYDYVDIFELKKEYLDSIPFNEKIRRYHCDFNKQQINTKYDNIIMNPPYIKMQDLSKDYRKYLKTILRF